MDTYCDDAIASPTIVSMRAPGSLPYDVFTTRLRDAYGLIIGVGIGELDGIVWRIGNMAAQATQKRAALLLESVQKLIHGR